MQFDTGNTAWVLTSTALVLLMTPGLAFFYAGMVRPKNVISILLQNYVTMALVGLMWVVVGFTLAFGPDLTGGLIGNFHFVGLGNLSDAVVPGYVGPLAQTIPPLAFIGFQMMFAVITPALVTGSIAERMKFTPFVFFIIVWSLLVYAPIAHWVFSPLGWLFEDGALDFAGGTVVHINAGAAGLALAIVLGRRIDWPALSDKQHNNLPFLLLGAGMLWVGWFGFNAGSALGANNLASYALINTNTATSAALLSWLLTERVRGSWGVGAHSNRRGRGGRATALGAGSGAVAGLVAITPAAGFVNPFGAIIIGLVAGVACCLACGLKYRFKIDDALDVVGVHLVAGIVGALSLGFVATTQVNELGRNGLFYGGDWSLLNDQLAAAMAVGVYSFVATYIIAKVLDVLFVLRVPEEVEEVGLDLALHNEAAYDFASAGNSERSERFSKYLD